MMKNQTKSLVQKNEKQCRALPATSNEDNYLVINVTKFNTFQTRGRVPTRQGKVREIWFFFKVREKSGNSVKWSGKLENLQKSGKSQEILKSCLVNPSKN